MPVLFVNGCMYRQTFLLIRLSLLFPTTHIVINSNGKGPIDSNGHKHGVCHATVRSAHLQSIAEMDMEMLKLCRMRSLTVM